MSKRKYAKNVSKMLYTWNVDGETAWKMSALKDRLYQSPIRIVRESFYRKLIKIYEKFMEGK